MDSTDAQIIAQLGALAQTTRLQAFKALVRAGAKGIAAGQLAASLNVAPNTLSAHLSILQRSGLVRHRRNGRSVIYSVDMREVSSMISALITDCCAGYPDGSVELAKTIDNLSC